MRITTFSNHETLMNQVTLLRDALRPHLAWHGARLSFVAAFLIALLRVKTCEISENCREIIKLDKISSLGFLKFTL
jgi:hypothetical protein